MGVRRTTAWVSKRPTPTTPQVAAATENGGAASGWSAIIRSLSAFPRQNLAAFHRSARRSIEEKMAKGSGDRVAIVAGVRTAFAKQGTAYRALSALDLGKLAVAELLSRT